MGEFRKYRPYYACNALRFSSMGPLTYAGGNKWGGIARVPNFKDISGTEYGWLTTLNTNRTYTNNDNNVTSASGIAIPSVKQFTFLAGNYEHFTYLTPFATTDKLANYDINDYDYRQNMVGQTYIQRAAFVAEDVNKILYSMSIFNDNADSYAANDDPAFVADTFYSLVDGNYILLSAEPADWGTNYTNYYKLVPAEDIKVSCIKFRNCMSACNIASRSYSSPYGTETNNTNILALLCAYFLDEEITIHPGDSYLLSLSFESSQF